MSPHLILWATFAVVMVAFIVVDLGWLNRKAHAVSMASSVRQSLFWIGISLAYAALVWLTLGAAPASEFLSAYVTEKILSVDNLFVILLIFTYFQVRDEYRHRVLYWGIMGAVVMRGMFIIGGTALVSRFHWLLYFFGAFLIYSGLKLLKAGGEDDEMDVSQNRVMRWCQKHLPLVAGDGNGKFMVKEHGMRFFTTLFVALLVVETSDIMFAFDSIPAVLAITQDPLIAFTSNMFAVMGLRALFFLVENLMKSLRYLQQGLCFILTFIGAKMLLTVVDVHISSVASLCVVLTALIVATVASKVIPEKAA